VQRQGQVVHGGSADGDKVNVHTPGMEKKRLICGAKIRLIHDNTADRNGFFFH
jgi:hypothetical protein